MSFADNKGNAALLLDAALAAGHIEPAGEADDGEPVYRVTAAGVSWAQAVIQRRSTDGADLIAAGWLPPDEAERLRQERDQAIAHDRQPYPTAEAYETACHAVHYYRDIAQSATALLVQEHGRQLRAKVEAGAAASLPDFPTLVAELAAVQPVIDAARELVAAPFGLRNDAFQKLRAALADSPPEGPKQ